MKCQIPLFLMGSAYCFEVHDIDLFQSRLTLKFFGVTLVSLMLLGPHSFIKGNVTFHQVTELRWRSECVLNSSQTLIF